MYSRLPGKTAFAIGSLVAFVSCATFVPDGQTSSDRGDANVGNPFDGGGSGGDVDPRGGRFVQDTFESTLAPWEYVQFFTDNTTVTTNPTPFTLTRELGPEPRGYVARVHGNWDVSVWATGFFGAKRVYRVPEGATKGTLTFWYRVSSTVDYNGNSHANFYWSVQQTNEALPLNMLQENVLDTQWILRQEVISLQAGVETIEVAFYMKDAWEADYHFDMQLDDVSIFWE